MLTRHLTNRLQDSTFQQNSIQNVICIKNILISIQYRLYFCNVYCCHIESTSRFAGKYKVVSPISSVFRRACWTTLQCTLVGEQLLTRVDERMARFLMTKSTFIFMTRKIKLHRTSILHVEFSLRDVQTKTNSF